jgi:hypothetical protein
MKAIADALVYAVTYINLRDAADPRYDDGDVGALESIAGYLHDATVEEQDALLAEAAERALVGERAGPARSEFIADFPSWMEDMFGEGWQGNRRVPGASNSM